MGELDQEAFEQLWDRDADEAAELLALMARATDRELAALARRLAGRIFVDLTASGPARTGGVGRLVTTPARPDSTDLDLDASLDAIHRARTEGRRPGLDDLQARQWAKPDTAVCLIVDRSGSMNGTRLATAALAAAACTWRAPSELAVLAFADKVLTLKGLQQRVEPNELVSMVLALRGHGTTDLDLALKAARVQLARAGCRRRVALLLSDGEHTTGADPVPAARSLDELIILAPADEPDHAHSLARMTGATVTTLAGPLDVVSALNSVLA